MKSNYASFIGGPSNQYRPAVIPSGWAWVELSEVARLESGHTPDRKEPEYWNGTIPWVSLQDTSRLDANFISNTAFNITELGIAKSSARILPAGTVIFSRTATVGKATILAADMATSQDFANWVCGPKVLNQYLMHVLRAMDKTWSGLMAGSTHNTIYMPDFKRMCILLPSFDEQNAIASLLSSWDRAIRQLTDLIAAKVRFKQGLMQQLLTGKRRFRRYVQSDALQSSAAGDIPSDWELRRLGDVTEEVRRKNDAGVTLVLTASGNQGLVDQRDYFNRSVAGKSLAGYYHLKRGEFAYNRSLMKGYPYGATKRLDLYDEGVVSTLYLCFRIVSEVCNTDWLAHLFESEVFNSQLRGIAKMGARAHGLLNIASSEFFQMVLPMPSKEEQAAIASTLDKSEKEISLLEKQLDSLKQQKKGLMQKLLTGQIRVPDSFGSEVIS